MEINMDAKTQCEDCRKVKTDCKTVYLGAFCLPFVMCEDCRQPSDNEPSPSH